MAAVTATKAVAVRKERREEASSTPPVGELVRDGVSVASSWGDGLAWGRRRERLIASCLQASIQSIQATQRL